MRASQTAFMKHKTIPNIYKSGFISKIKKIRQESDSKKKDLSPTILDFGGLTFKLSRHFGFCFGVENAIDIAYRAINNNQSRRVFLLSEMIHNPEVNEDLLSRGVKFLMKTNGERLVDFKQLTPDDLVIVPAFGTTIEIQNELKALGIDPYQTDATCPFVQKVWKRTSELGDKGYSVIIHGKKTHEETRATFSHSIQKSKSLVILNIDDAYFLADFILGNNSVDQFWDRFNGCTSDGFDPKIDLERLGVVNQTTMLATETWKISEIIKEAFTKKYGTENLKDHFADTRDTLCYATNENQNSTNALINSGFDIAIVVGGFNSSNTTHLVELCENISPTYFIRNSNSIISLNEIHSFDIHKKELVIAKEWAKNLTLGSRIAITSGASCPDILVEEVIEKIVNLSISERIIYNTDNEPLEINKLNLSTAKHDGSKEKPLQFDYLSQKVLKGLKEDYLNS